MVRHDALVRGRWLRGRRGRAARDPSRTHEFRRIPAASRLGGEAAEPATMVAAADRIRRNSVVRVAAKRVEIDAEDCSMSLAAVSGAMTGAPGATSGGGSAIP